MNILITGAGGFLGRHLAKALQERGHKVVNFSRNEYPDLAEQGIETLQGDLQNYEDVLDALENMDVVYHLASKVGMWGEYQDYFNTNVKGTRNLLKACKEKQVKKFIYTSSPSVVFGKNDLEGIDESYPYPKRFLNHYAKTKAIAEKEVLKANSESLATVALRPHLIFGPGDPHLFPRLVEMAKKGRLKQVGEGNNLVDIIYVQNAVDAHLLALEKLDINSVIAGKAYFLGQEKPVKLWDFIDDVLKRYKAPEVDSQISAKAAYRVGALLEFIYKILGTRREPPMTRFVAKQLSCSHYFDHTNAEKELGYKPKINIEQALELTVR